MDQPPFQQHRNHPAAVPVSAAGAGRAHAGGRPVLSLHGPAVSVEPPVLRGGPATHFALCPWHPGGATVRNSIALSHLGPVWTRRWSRTPSPPPSRRTATTTPSHALLGAPPPKKKKRKKEKKKKKKKKTHNNTKHNHRLRCAALAPGIDLGRARTPRRWSVARALESTAIDGTGCVGAGTKSAG